MPQRGAVFSPTVSSSLAEMRAPLGMAQFTMSSPQSTSIGAEISPVQAPASSQCMFCAPTLTLAPDSSAFTCRRR